MTANAKPFIRPAGCTDAIVLLVSLYCGIKVPEIVGSSRKRSVQHARMLAQFLIYTCTALSTPEVAEHFNLDHSTVVNNIKTVRKTAEVDTGLQAAIVMLTEKARLQFEGGFEATLRAANEALSKLGTGALRTELVREGPRSYERPVRRE